MLLNISLGLTAVVLSTSCAKTDSFDGQQLSSDNSSLGVEKKSPYKPLPLIWESTKYPVRTTWSAMTFKLVDKSFSDLDKATDISVFCPKYSNLSRNQRINVWSNLIAALAYYESGWDPKSNSVDVGSAGDLDTYSVGLLQMSVVDQDNYNLLTNYSFSELQTPQPNLEIGITILARQIIKRGKILIPVGGSGLYWATLHPGGKYDQTSAIAKMTKKMSICQ